MSARLDDLNMLRADEAAREFLRCCGSDRWAKEMAAARPFASIEAVVAAADNIWSALAPDDWLQAFAAHPRIGESGGAGGSGGSGEPGTSSSSFWSRQEQAGMRDAGDAARARLAARNRDYEARFGYIFIVCATGRSAGEMLAALERRLAHDPDHELVVAAEEQRKIIHVRIAKLLE